MVSRQLLGYLFLPFIFFCHPAIAGGAHLFIETESFSDKGGWSTDAQFADAMGSPYLLAHGLGKPVEDASSDVLFPEKGRYHVYARTYNWTSPWKAGDGPGEFQVKVDGDALPGILGREGTEWEWQYAGAVDIASPSAKISLHDLRGFDGRCDALYLTTDFASVPPASGKSLADFRNSFRGRHEISEAGIYDLVVIGGGTGAEPSGARGKQQL